MTARHALDLAAGTLARGGIVAHALEGVWGLACDPFDADVVARLLWVKRRPVAKGLIVIAASASDFGVELRAISAEARQAIIDGWPAAETWVVPNQRFPYWITGAASTVAIRVPAHDQARALAERFGGPIVSTSANLNRRPPATSELLVRKHFTGTVDYILSGVTAGARGPSRIRAVDGGRVLR